MRMQKVLLCLVSALVFPFQVAAAPGNLDNSFGIQGLILTDVHDILTGTAGIGSAISVAIHPAGDPNAGKIVAVGFTQAIGYDFALARYNADGSLDTSFGNNGVVETDVADADILSSVLILPPGDPNAGKILVGGTSGDAPPLTFALARYCADGQLDDGVNCGTSAFGNAGIATTDFGGDESRIQGLALQADGKIVAAGFSNGEGTFDFAMARYNPDGSLDASFNPSGSLPGTVVTDFAGDDDQANAVAIYPAGDPNAGKILAAGFATDGEEDLAFARYCPDGSLDTGGCGGSEFASGGTLSLDPAGDELLAALTLQADGKAVGAGNSNNGIDEDFILVRLCGDGSLDDGANCGAGGFGAGGFVITEFGDASEEEANAVALQADGKILAAGFSNAEGFGQDFAVAGYLADGALDYGFGSAGVALQDFSCLCSDSLARSMALQPDGKIVLAGASDANPQNSFNNFALARFVGDPVDPIAPSADLAVGLSSEPTDPLVGDSVSFTVSVTNNGPDAAAAVFLNALLIGPASDVAVDNESCSVGSGTVNCEFGALESGASATATITLLVQGFPFSLVADVDGDVIDPDFSNNQAVLSLNGTSGGDDGGCSLNPAQRSSSSPLAGGLLVLGIFLAAIRKRSSI